ncbi:hypothetical protein CS542_06830 [Pedobacter sp. IW39]|nr:hypothetical protein CS542_06830 [Pedobacter sp. IW39]
MTPYHRGANSASRGGGALGATQNQVDAFFFMQNGKVSTMLAQVMSGFAATATNIQSRCLLILGKP